MPKTLFRSVSLVSLMTFISRILGFGRDLIAAQIFGVSASVDAFYIAFKIPNFMRNLFAEGSFSQAFVPVLADYQQKHRLDAVKVFVSRMMGSLGITLLLVSFLGVFFAQYLVNLFSPGLDPYRFVMATHMLRITFPYLMLISLTAFAGSILNSYGKFGIPSLTPALLNISLIATALGMRHWFVVPVVSQAWGVLIAGFVQLFFVSIALYRLGFLVRPRLMWRDSGVRRVLVLLIPALFGASMGQLSILLNTILASFLVTGSITWLYYSERLAYFPLGIFGVALATVVLPHLSRQHALAAKSAFSAALDWGLRWNLIIAMPAAISMLILSGPLTVSLFYYGKFGAYDVFMTQKSVVTYGFGLPAFMLQKMLSSAFYAQQDIRTPVKLSTISLAANMVLSLILIGPLAHAGLALASSLGAWLNVLMLWVVAGRRDIYKAQAAWALFVLKLIVANVVLGLFLWIFAVDTSVWMDWNWVARLSHIVCLGLGGLALYILCLWLSRAWPQQEIV